MTRLRITIVAMLMLCFMVKGQGTGAQTTSRGYRIDKPGTITFTVGLKIKGKVEKPQVMIFLPKDKAYYRELDLSHSFRKQLLKPMPFTPITR